jgi:hypothetical protein
MTITLRHKKIYQTRLALAELFIEKLEEEKFESISIKDICEQTEVSEATFYNYFPQKIDVIAYWFKVKLYKILWTINNLHKNLSFTQSIEKTFELFAKEIKHPYLFYEVISIFGTSRIKINNFSLSEEELKYIYPEYKQDKKIPLINLSDFFTEKIDLQFKDGKIPQNVCKKTLCQFLLTILKGVPLSTPISEFNKIAEIYQKHLSLLWKILQL